MKHTLSYSVPVQHPEPQAGLNMLGAGRCAHVVRCKCGDRFEGRGNTKDAARKRAEEAHRCHARDQTKAAASRLFEEPS